MPQPKVGLCNPKRRKNGLFVMEGHVETSGKAQTITLKLVAQRHAVGGCQDKRLFYLGEKRFGETFVPNSMSNSLWPPGSGSVMRISANFDPTQPNR